MNAVEEHRSLAPTTVTCIIVTVSDTRTPETDESGLLMKTMLQESGYHVVDHLIIKDEYELIRETIHEVSSKHEVQALLFTGGTGISKRDCTYEAVSSLLDKELTGFGEIFRFLSYEEIGAAAILSRAIGGTVGTTAVFSMPGSRNAVRLAMEKILIPELRHIVRELNKHS
ncbi:molybdenum cofactor biosynthesis protein B [Paenibacillus sp. GCM10028914]|uniref:MogA/MoaB family molybdenum cofactor biosynthesis protein n=1 Tax=Paenibacillus sp. GCM10028914 TaxID=3273416 RepID=UPI0036201DEF